MAEKYYDSSIKISSSFGVGARVPLDARTVCATMSDMEAIPDTRKYEGLTVYVEENKKTYYWNGSEWEQRSIEKVIDELDSDITDIGLSAAKGKYLNERINTLVEVTLPAVKKELQTAISELESTVEGNDSSTQTSIQDIKDDIETINNTLNTLQNTTITSIQSAITALQTVDQTINKTISDLQLALSARIKALEDLNISTRLTTLEGNDKTQDTNIDNLQSKTNNHETRIDALEGNDKTQNSDIDALQSTTSTHTSQISSIVSKNSEQDTSINSLIGRVTDLEASTGTVQGQVGKVKVEESGNLGFLNEKIIEGDENHEEDIFKVNVTKENDKLKLDVNIPMIRWEKL